MSTSPNQRWVCINKTKVEKGTGTNRPYLVAYTDIIEASAKELSGNAFKLYIYLLSNINNYQFGFSSKDVSERYGCSVDTVRSSFKILVDKGFLTLEKGSNTKYIFKDTIEKQEITENIEDKKDKIYIDNIEDTENIETKVKKRIKKEFYF